MTQPIEQGGKPAKRQSWVSLLFKYGLPLIITVGLCYVLFTGINFDEMMATIRTADFTWIGLALFISIFSHIFRAMRWRIQLKALGVDAPLFAVVLSIFGTYAVNLVFPRLGEVWRTGYIAERQKASFTTIFGSMVADRLADTITVFLLTVVTFILASQQLISYFAQTPETYEKLMGLATSPWLWLAVVVCVAALWWLIKGKTTNGLVLKIRQFIMGLWEGFAVVFRMPGKGRWLLLTFCIWGCYFSQLWVAFYAFDFTSEVIANHTILAVLVCFVLSSLSMAVPANGGIGPWQWAIIFGLGIYAVPKGPAAAFANLVLGSQTLLLILLGIFTFVCIALQKRRKVS